jgi:hypothetical protein
MELALCLFVHLLGNWNDMEGRGRRPFDALTYLVDETDGNHKNLWQDSNVAEIRKGYLQYEGQSADHFTATFGV